MPIGIYFGFVVVRFCDTKKYTIKRQRIYKYSTFVLEKDLWLKKGKPNQDIRKPIQETTLFSFLLSNPKQLSSTQMSQRSSLIHDVKPIDRKEKSSEPAISIFSLFFISPSYMSCYLVFPLVQEHRKKRAIYRRQIGLQLTSFLLLLDVDLQIPKRLCCLCLFQEHLQNLIQQQGYFRWASIGLLRFRRVKWLFSRTFKLFLHIICLGIE